MMYLIYAFRYNNLESPNLTGGVKVHYISDIDEMIAPNEYLFSEADIRDIMHQYKNNIHNQI